MPSRRVDTGCIAALHQPAVSTPADRHPIDPISQAIGKLEGRFDQFEKRVDDRFDAVDARFNAIDRHFESLERLLYVVIGILVTLVGGGIAVYLRIAELATPR